MNKILLTIAPLFAVLLVTHMAFGQAQTTQGCPNAIDYVDSTYGSKIRQLKQPDGHEHNIYYHRNPWNADNTYLIGIQSDLQQKNWRVVLYDGDGCFINVLFTLADYDWRLVWDRIKPDILYTWKGSNLYRYNVVTGKSDLLKSFAPLGFKPPGPSLNQASDRILVITSDGAFHSYHLPDMQQERTFKVNYPPDCSSSWKNERYIGYLNYISTACKSPNFSTQAILVYDDNGSLVHQFDGIGGGGHYDFAPDGRLAYLKMGRGGAPLEIHLVDIDGTNNRVLYSAPRSQVRYVQNLHISWPDKANTYFFVSFFPSARNLPAEYAPPLDEILMMNTSGKYKILGRTNTTIRTREQEFWAEPLASPSSDGSRVSFNSNRSGTIDQYILWVSPSVAGETSPP